MKCAICGATVERGTVCPKCRSNVFSTKPSKYHAQRVDTEDGKFDSKLEFRRWRELKLLERAGVITELKRQVRIPLIPQSKYGREIAYVADSFTGKTEKSSSRTPNRKRRKHRFTGLKNGL